MFGNTIFNFFEQDKDDYFQDYEEYKDQIDFTVSTMNKFIPPPLYK